MAIKIAGTEVINDNRELVLAKLTEINTSIADTAVDIFVYDTRKDSDGGAWRKRTQGTSWYNETLNTATRGSRKEFPAVAVIVVEQREVHIYDGDDPDLPMWMVFTETSSGLGSFIGYSTVSDKTSVAMKNGILAVGCGETQGNTQGLRLINFISESYNWKADSSSRNATISNAPIVDRNSALPTGFDDGNYIVNEYINDVAMTVLPNAPIDAATGLPVPTIAVATDGGVSVIKDDGTVVDITGSQGSAFSVTTRVSIDNNNVYFVGPNTNRCNIVKAIPSSDTTFNSQPEIATDKFALYEGNNSTLNGVFANGNLNVTKVEGLGNNAVATNGDSLNLFSDATGNQTGMAAYVASDYNTGWMNGDIKLATLSDTDDTNVTGSELVTNGTFDTDTSGWSANNATLSVDAGRLKVVDNGSSAVANQTISVTAGETYVITFDATSGTAACQAYVDDGTLTVIGSNISDGVFSYTYTVPSGVSSFVLGLNNTNGITGQYCFFDNISVRLAEPDRSVNGNGLQVFGTVTKSAVATGADLVGYSGFSASNYIKQPQNADMFFGTGDFAIMLWVKFSSANAQHRLVSVSQESSPPTQNLILLDLAADSEFSTRIGLAAGNSIVTLGANTWNHVALIRSSGVAYVYVNGENTFSYSATGNTDGADASMFIGKSANGTLPPPGTEMALLRVSKTAPSLEQMQKIYEDEKVLFQENAQATLYGSSDAVTALAYDDSTELLHVGTSAGRSVFQGLRRVDNTTTAVGAAISASNGLVADE